MTGEICKDPTPVGLGHRPGDSFALVDSMATLPDPFTEEHSTPAAGTGVGQHF